MQFPEKICKKNPNGYTLYILLHYTFGLGTYLWQNFLADSKVRHWIATRVQDFFTELQATQLREIWPGKGAITKLIKDITSDFTVIEKDSTLKTGLEVILGQQGKIVMDDVLNLDLACVSSQAFVIGNLPYYITSPILRKFFGNGQSQVLWGLFMVQAEVGEKIKRDAHKKSYLYRLLNYAYHVEYLKTVPAKAFNPPPKVKSCLISLVKKSELPQLPFAKLVSFLDAVAPYSRKTLGKISKILEKHPNKVAFSIPEHIKGKRLEAVYREELEEIMG